MFTISNGRGAIDGTTGIAPWYKVLQHRFGLQRFDTVPEGIQVELPN